MFREVVARPAASSEARFEVALPSGVSVLVAPSFDAEARARLLAVLGHAC
jgi:hypothetical protein